MHKKIILVKFFLLLNATFAVGALSRHHITTTDPSIEQAGRNLGAGPLENLWLVNPVHDS